MRTMLLFITIAASACAPKAPLAPSTCQHALVLYSEGKSEDQVAESLDLADRETARAAIHQAIRNVQRRLYAER